jgi:hypothetical protein
MAATDLSQLISAVVSYARTNWVLVAILIAASFLAYKHASQLKTSVCHTAAPKPPAPPTEDSHVSEGYVQPPAKPQQAQQPAKPQQAQQPAKPVPRGLPSPAVQGLAAAYNKSS